MDLFGSFSNLNAYKQMQYSVYMTIGYGAWYLDLDLDLDNKTPKQQRDQGTI